MSDDTAFSMVEARKLWTAKGGTATKTARKSKRKKIADTVDKRTLRATRRSEQFNFRARAGLKEKAQQAAEAAGVTVAEWMELAVEAYLAQDQEQSGA